MKDYLMLIVFPSKTFDKIDTKKPDGLTLFLIWTIIVAALALPKFFTEAINNHYEFAIVFGYLIGYLIVLPILYFPFVYGVGYFFWIVSKGFKGVSSFVEMRNLMVYFILPFILQAILSIPFITAGLIKNDVGLITHNNYLTQLIMWLLSFRILMVGIAKYNKFNWMITIFIWLIATTVLGGFAYLLLQLKK